MNPSPHDNGELEHIGQFINEQFAPMARSLAVIQEKVTHIEAHLAKMNGRLGKVEQTLQDLEVKQARADGRLSTVETQMDKKADKLVEKIVYTLVGAVLLTFLGGLIALIGWKG